MVSDGCRPEPRIVRYGVGANGQELARLASVKGWPIVAALNRKGDKVGTDPGRLAGFDDENGVVIQDCEAADLSSLNAGVGVVFTTDSLGGNGPAYERLLDADINVICHGVQAYYPWR